MNSVLLVPLTKRASNQLALGHHSASVTLDTYSHLWPDASDRTRKAAGALLEQSLGSTADALRTNG